MALSVAHRTPADRAEVLALTFAGAQVFEVDVRLLRGQLAVTHYQPVHRRLPKVQRDNWRVRVGAPAAPGLADVIALIPQECEIMLDLKDDSGPAAMTLAEALNGENLDLGRLHASSKHWSSLQILADQGWRTWRTVHTRARLGELLAAGLQGAWAATVRHSLLRPPGKAEAIVARCGRVLAWTVNDPGRAQTLLGRGLSGITTDSPAVHAAVRSW